ncbi:MAG: hypothetical protein AAFZ15_28125, partial [Bacteroidota bacterium]
MILNRINLFFILIVFAALICFQSCYRVAAKSLASDIGLEVIQDYSVEYGEEYNDKGLAEELDRLPVGSSLNIILTHGIGTPSDARKRFKELLIMGLGSSTNRPNIGPRKYDAYNVKDCTGNFLIAQANVYRSVYYLRNNKTIVLYDVEWSPITHNTKYLIDTLDSTQYA